MDTKGKFIFVILCAAFVPCVANQMRRREERAWPRSWGWAARIGR